MANNEIKTNAEIYREQRKERLNKASKRKHSAKSDKIIRILLKVLCIVLVVALVGLGSVKLLTESLYVPQKVLTAATYGDMKINVAQFNYYYMLVYNNMYSQAYQYEQSYSSYYGSGVGAQITGFDYTADPALQDYTADDEEDDKIATWADYFKSEASAAAFTNITLYNDSQSNEAKEKGFELSDAKIKDIDEQIDKSITSLQEKADDADYSLDNYISLTCGEGLTEKTYREYLKHDQIASEYLSWYKENQGDELTEKDITAYYKENIGTYAKASARVFTVSFAASTTTTSEATSKDETYTQKQAKARANEFKAAITDEASFIALSKQYCQPSQKETYADDSTTLLINNMTEDNIKQNNEDLATWIFDSKRAVGDTTVIEDKTNSVYYIAYLVSLPAPDKSPANVAVRHILFNAATTTTDSDGNSVDLDEKTVVKNLADAKKKAEDVLKEWKNGKATEDSFAALATSKSEDTGSTETGGLYDDINTDSSYVDEFKAWALDSSRKAGDTGIVKTTYGYHVMYFVSAEKEQKWHSDVKAAIASNNTTDYQTKIYDKIKAEVKENKSIIDYFCGRIQKKISSTIANNASSAATNATVS